MINGWQFVTHNLGGELDSTGLQKHELRVVVGQLATLKADYKF